LVLLRTMLLIYSYDEHQIINAENKNDEARLVKD